MTRTLESFGKHPRLPRTISFGKWRTRMDIITPIIKDDRNSGTPIEVEFSGNLYPEQLLAAEALKKHDIGVLSATTAFGKTVVAF